MPISVSRVTALGASFVCSVDSTRWPVRAASTASCAVIRSRISPISTMSGSERRIAGSTAANVRPALWFTCTWFTPGSRYSTGSSTVMMLTVGLLISASVAYSVVDFPEPVGPVTSSMPCGLLNETEYRS